MKIGFIVECGPQGAETQVIPYLAKMIREDIEPDVIPLDKKPILKRDCGEFAREIAWKQVPDSADCLGFASGGEYEGKGAGMMIARKSFPH